MLTSLLPTPLDPSPRAPRQASGSPDPKSWTKKHSGMGGQGLRVPHANSPMARSPQFHRPVTAPAGAQRWRGQRSATRVRANPPNTDFRRAYERGDLPCQIDHSGGSSSGPGRKLMWKVDLTKLDYHHYLPLFVDGLCEEEEPYLTIASCGVLDMLDAGAGKDKILPIVPQLIIPIKTALNTRERKVMVRVIKFLKKLIVTDVVPGRPDAGLIGQALVPYYRQVLPVLNIFISHNANIGDHIAYGQRHETNLGDLIREVLELMETYGGEDAFINIKYLVPTYESIMMS